MKTYTQHSKKLAVWSLTQWIAVVACIVFIVWFADTSPAETDLLASVVTWSATLAGVVVSGYMGNSAAEKYATHKFKQLADIDCDQEESVSNG